MRSNCVERRAGRLTILFAIVAGTLLTPAPAYAAEAPDKSGRQEGFSTNAGDTAVVRLLARDGQIATADLLAELGRVAGLDLRAVERLLPDGQLNLARPKTERRIATLNRFVGRYAQMRIVRRAGRGEPQLEIAIDRGQMHTDQRRAKSVVRTVSLDVLDPRGALRSRQPFGLILDDDAVRRPDERLVVGVHGFSGSASAMDAFLNPLRQTGSACASFVYPNDQAIADSASLLSDKLKALARREPKRRVAIVAFSMGGLVARAAIEDPKLDPGNIDRLVMIAPPNHGSLCARFALGFDLYEHIAIERRRELRELLAGSLADGLGEARQDLCPDSRFLRELNARQRNPHVRYTILLGEGGELNAEQVDRIVSSIDKLEQKSAMARLLAPKLERLRKELGELSQPSDGWVTVDRGRLEGVDDIETLCFRHVERFDDLENERVQALHDAVAKRLE